MRWPCTLLPIYMLIQVNMFIWVDRIPLYQRNDTVTRVKGLAGKGQASPNLWIILHQDNLSFPKMSAKLVIPQHFSIQQFKFKPEIYKSKNCLCFQNRIYIRSLTSPRWQRPDWASGRRIGVEIFFDILRIFSRTLKADISCFQIRAPIKAHR